MGTIAHKTYSVRTLSHMWDVHLFSTMTTLIRCKKTILGSFFVCLFVRLFSFYWFGCLFIFFIFFGDVSFPDDVHSITSFFFSRTLDFKVCLAICSFLLDLSLCVRGCICVCLFSIAKIVIWILNDSHHQSIFLLLLTFSKPRNSWFVGGFSLPKNTRYVYLICSFPFSIDCFFFSTLDLTVEKKTLKQLTEWNT